MIRSLKKKLLILLLASVLSGCNSTPKIDASLIDTFCTNYSRIAFEEMSDKAVNHWHKEISELAYIKYNNSFKSAKEEYMFFILNSVYENEKLYSDKKCYNK